MQPTETVELKSVTEMTDRELLEEMATRARATEKLVVGFITSMEKNPMMRAMMGRMGQ